MDVVLKSKGKEQRKDGDPAIGGKTKEDEWSHLKRRAPQEVQQRGRDSERKVRQLKDCRCAPERFISVVLKADCICPNGTINTY